MMSAESVVGFHKTTSKNLLNLLNLLKNKMKIKEGFNGKETRIRIYGKKEGRTAELWIEQTGLNEKETLSYMSVDELLDLKDEVEIALKEITN